MSKPILRKAPPLFLGVIPSKTYDSWAGDPIFLGWGSDPDLWPQMVKIWRSTKWSKKGPQIFLTRAKCIEFQGEQLWFSLKKLRFFRFFWIWDFFDKYFQKWPKNVKKKFPKMLFEVVWRIHMEIHGSEWVRMTYRDSHGASWGFLGPQGGQKGGFGVFGAGGTPRLAPLLALSWANRLILTYMA